MANSPIDKANAALVIVSEILSASEIQAMVGLKPSKLVMKGAETGLSDPTRHPANIVVFSSGLDQTNPLEEHLCVLMDLIENLQTEFDQIKDSCRVSVTCLYEVGGEGGWSLSPEMLSRMARSKIEFVFSVLSGQTVSTLGP